jgi:hypothetical protein
VDEIASTFNDSAQGTHFRTLWLEWLELVAVTEQQLEHDLGVGRVVLRRQA